jgi:hypothetical protein
LFIVLCMYFGGVFHYFFSQQSMVSNMLFLPFHHYFSDLALDGTYLMFSPFSTSVRANGSLHETSPGLPQLYSPDASSIMW